MPTMWLIEYLLIFTLNITLLMYILLPKLHIKIFQLWFAILSLSICILFITRDLASDPSTRHLDGCKASETGRKTTILDHLTSFQAILAILDNFGRALLFKKTDNFEILAKSLFITDMNVSSYILLVCIQLHFKIFQQWFAIFSYSIHILFIIYIIKIDSSQKLLQYLRKKCK